MKKKNMLKLFLTGFLKSLLMIFIFFMVGFGSYKITMFYYNSQNKEPAASELIASLVSQNVELQSVSKNLICCTNDSSGEITKMVLEIYNTSTANLDYITIPVNTKFTISNELYEKMCALKLEAPQIIKFSDLHNYFDKDNICPYAVVLLNDMLNVEAGYYTEVDAEKFSEMFKESERELTAEEAVAEGVLTEEEAESEDAGALIHNYSIFTIKKSFIKTVKKMTTEEQIKGYISSMYEGVRSNLNLSAKTQYAATYLNVNPDYIYTYSIYGKDSTDGFEVDVERTNRLIASILANSAYTKGQNETIEEVTTVSSKDLVLEVLNGSQIAGIAAAYQEKLNAEGFHVAEIGNYNGETLEKTEILVREEGMGEDLLAYFPEATIITTVIPTGTDIQIILGKDADETVLDEAGESSTDTEDSSEGEDSDSESEEW